MTPTNSKEQALQYAIARARNDIKFFGKFMFGHDPAKHHAEFFDSLFKYDRILMVWPREFGKTASMITAMIWWMGHFPNHTNIITSVNSEQAKLRLGTIKRIITEDTRYRMVFPWVLPDEQKPWTETKINIYDDRIGYQKSMDIRKRAGTDISSSIFSIGMSGSGLVGNRISGLGIVDDPHDESTAYSPTKRERGITWYNRSYINCLQKGAKCIIITTRWHQWDLAGDIMADPGRASRYKVFQMGAWEHNEDGELVSNWPDHFTIEDLKEKENEITPTMFRALYLNDVNALVGANFDIDWLNHRLPENLPEMDRIIISVDPAVTTKKRSNYTAIATVGIDKRNNIYLLNMYHRKLSIDKLGRLLENLYESCVDEYSLCNGVIVEKAGQQVLITDQILADINVPVTGVNFKGDKLQKAQKFIAVSAGHRFFAPWEEDWARAFKSQCLSFDGVSNVEGDDMIDAVAQACNYFFNRSSMTRAKASVIQNEFML